MTREDEKPRATLSDRQARGGVIGGKGYTFQAAYIVSHIPEWLGDDDFVQFLQEGAGDVDVHFRREGREERWYIQVKNYQIGASEGRKVLRQFQETDRGTPGTYSRFTLACPGLKPNLKRLRAAIEDLRGTVDFYDSDEAIIENTWDDLKELIGSLGLEIEMQFLADKVHFDTDLAGLTDDNSLRDLFVGRLLRLGSWKEVTHAAAVRAYERLALQAHREIRRNRKRQDIESDIEKALGRRFDPLASSAVSLIASSIVLWLMTSASLDAGAKLTSQMVLANVGFLLFLSTALFAVLTLRKWAWKIIAGLTIVVTVVAAYQFAESQTPLKASVTVEAGTYYAAELVDILRNKTGGGVVLHGPLRSRIVDRIVVMELLTDVSLQIALDQIFAKVDVEVVYEAKAGTVLIVEGDPQS